MAEEFMKKLLKLDLIYEVETQLTASQVNTPGIPTLQSNPSLNRGTPRMGSQMG